MGSGPDEKYLEESGYLTPKRSSPPLAIPGALKAASRFIPPLSLGLLVALVIGGLALFAHARMADDRLETAHRNALRSGIEQFSLGKDSGAVDAQTAQLLQDLSGVRNLRWETEPDHRGREVQSVLDPHGRILGWLSWDSER